MATNDLVALIEGEMNSEIPEDIWDVRDLER
jgi:hypothetical protein